MTQKLNLIASLIFTALGVPALLLFGWAACLILPTWLVGIWLLASVVMNYIQWANIDIGHIPSPYMLVFLVVVVLPIAALAWPVSVPGAIQEWREGTLRLR